MDNRTEAEFRQDILRQVEAYAEKFHQRKTPQRGEKISYAGRMYGKEEMVSLVDSALDFWLTHGKYADQFERELASYLGVRHCSLVNSGSSANLLAFMALTSPLLGARAISRGDEVITVAAGFPTTIAPILQFGAIPVFVDVTIPEYNVDMKQLEPALSVKTKAVMIAHTLGNPFPIKEVKEFCDKYNLWLIEDNCDSLGSQITIDGIEHFTGTIGDIGTSSFYPPHHMTMGEGGAVYTNNPLLHKIIQSMRDWGRDCTCPSGVDNYCGSRFDTQFGELPKGYDHKYVYSHFGYNLKATDLQAAIGVEQLKKLESFCNRRRENFNKLYAKLADLEKYVILPKALEDSDPSWFGFMITCRETISREELVKYLEESGVQTRMLFAGNILRQPCFDYMRNSNQGYKVIGELKNTDIIMKRSFWIGVYPGLTEEIIEYISEKIHNFLNK